MRHTFQTEQWVPYPATRVFAFFANPGNLPRLMPSWQRARIERSSIVAPPSVSSLSTGAAAGTASQMTISFRPLPFVPIRMKWKASIVEFVWNEHFCDEQPQGPFAYWRHCHRVSAEMRGRTEGARVVDDLVYELPLGALSEPIHKLFVRGQIEKIFAYRQQQLMKLLGAPEDPIS
jgi:ligand-binding SRPBCC domain-containing protein